jgi:hypothetical protein
LSRSDFGVRKRASAFSPAADTNKRWAQRDPLTGTSETEQWGAPWVKAEARVARRKVAAPEASSSFGASPRRRRRLWSAEACFRFLAGWRNEERPGRTKRPRLRVGNRAAGQWLGQSGSALPHSKGAELVAAWAASTLRRVTRASAFGQAAGEVARCRASRRTALARGREPGCQATAASCLGKAAASRPPRGHPTPKWLSST